MIKIDHSDHSCYCNTVCLQNTDYEGIYDRFTFNCTLLIRLLILYSFWWSLRLSGQTDSTEQGSNIFLKNQTWKQSCLIPTFNKAQSLVFSTWPYLWISMDCSQRSSTETDALRKHIWTNKQSHQYHNSSFESGIVTK